MVRIGSLQRRVVRTPVRTSKAGGSGGATTRAQNAAVRIRTSDQVDDHEFLNPRLHSEADLDKIAASILKWGWTNPALVDENGTLIAGHGRVAAAAKLKLTSIPVIVARGWSEDEKQAYRLADNELAARASWDTDLLRDELRLLQFSGFDLDLIGFEPDRLQGHCHGNGAGSDRRIG